MYHLAARRSDRMRGGVGSRCAVFLASVVLSGCIVLPIPIRESPPYRVGDNAKLTCGTTTRVDTLRSLGEPAARYCDGREFVYLAFQQRGVLVYGGLVPVPPIALPFGGATKYGKEHLLTVQFSDTGLLSDYELRIPKAESWTSDIKCTPAKVCIADGGVFRYAPVEVETQAKRFEPVAGRCAIYFYSEGSHNGLRIDKTEAAPVLGPDTFLWVVLEPGAHTFRVTAAPAPLWMDDERAASYRDAFGPETGLELNCEPDSLVFLRPRLRDESPQARSERYLVGPIDAVMGQRSLAERRLIMASDPWGAASCGNLTKK